MKRTPSTVYKLLYTKFNSHECSTDPYTLRQEILNVIIENPMTPERIKAQDDAFWQAFPDGNFKEGHSEKFHFKRTYGPTLEDLADKIFRSTYNQQLFYTLFHKLPYMDFPDDLKPENYINRGLQNHTIRSFFLEMNQQYKHLKYSDEILNRYEKYFLVCNHYAEFIDYSPSNEQVTSLLIRSAPRVAYAMCVLFTPGTDDLSALDNFMENHKITSLTDFFSPELPVYEASLFSKNFGLDAWRRLVLDHGKIAIEAFAHAKKAQQFHQGLICSNQKTVLSHLEKIAGIKSTSTKMSATSASFVPTSTNHQIATLPSSAAVANETQLKADAKEFTPATSLTMSPLTAASNPFVATPLTQPMPSVLTNTAPATSTVHQAAFKPTNSTLSFASALTGSTPKPQQPSTSHTPQQAGRGTNSGRGRGQNQNGAVGDNRHSHANNRGRGRGGRGGRGQ